MRPRLDRSDTIAISIYGSTRPNKRDCYTRHPFFFKRFTYGIDGDKVVFFHDKNKQSRFSRHFAIDKSNGLKGDISARELPSGVYKIEKYYNGFDGVSITIPSQKKQPANLFSAQGI